MKALVLCGGIPQIALIEELKKRGIFVILADMNPNVVARPYADQFFPTSVMDVEAIKKLAQTEAVDFVITVCADQVLLVQAEVSEKLGLPCYIDLQTARTVSSKELMKKIFVENGIPTSDYIISSEYNEDELAHLHFPLIVKPVDSYSSRGVRKVFNFQELKDAFENAVEISRTNTAIIEEFVDGEELTVDIYVENGDPIILSVSNIDKIPNNDKFVICRTRYPARISKELEQKIYNAARRIAQAFKLSNSPMLVQMIVKGEDISIVEFCARTGGGDKFKLIKDVSGFDVVKAVVDLTLGKLPHVMKKTHDPHFIINEFLYTRPGVLDHFEGLEELAKRKVIDEYYLLKPSGTKCGGISSSGDRVAYITVSSTDESDLLLKHKIAADTVKAVDANGVDLLRHDIMSLPKACDTFK